MAKHSLFGVFNFDWWFCRGHGMTRGGFLETLRFALRRPPELMVGGATEFAGWETVMERFEV